MKPHRLAAAAAMLAAAFAAVTSGATPSAAAACPVISARLGLHYPYYAAPHVVYPENSLGAIDAARAAGAGKLEVDVNFSRDGVPMDLHDYWLSRVTAHSGLAADYKAWQLKAMALKMTGTYASTWMSNQHVITLWQALDRATADGMTISVEVKPETLTYAQARAILYRLWWTVTEATVDIRSYQPQVLAQMRAAGYWGRLTLTTGGYVQSGAGYWQESIGDVKAGIVITADDVAALHAAGVRVDAYTPEGAAQYALVPAGVDQVTTDNVRALVAWQQAGHC